MTQEQVIHALMAALMGEGVTPQQIEQAVIAVRGLPLGTLIETLASPAVEDQAIVRAFINEQARLLGRA
jgi:hypothetical protein